MSIPEHRAFARNQFVAPLQLKMPKMEAIAFTHLYNFCRGGIYFESHLPILPGYETTVAVPDILYEPTAAGAYGAYRVRIRWCSELAKKSAKYGMGAQVLTKTEELTKAVALADHFLDCDLCDQRLEGEGVCYYKDMVCLCIPCCEHLKRFPAGILRESIMRFVYRNVV
jgi:hypothetical protein